jgi:malate dehydrogenase (oxaloacetate-decarboxylating)(NADP+)
MVIKQDSLNYHAGARPGKIEVIPTKPCCTQRDLSLAYTPGVADACLEIEKDPREAFSYTAKGNLVAVVSNGTAVLGLGDIGPLAGKPVMEGKAVLFKRFADVDVFDLEVDSHDPDDVIKLCQLLEPTFGGINLEDIKAPECFYIEETLKKTMQIPVFHDDQHGTAIISGAALLNALELVKKDIGSARVVINGAGAAGIACAEHYVALGVQRENIVLCDTKGVVYKGRAENMNPYKERFAQDTYLRTLADAMKGADVFVGLSVKDAVTQDMVRSMAFSPIIFALANPDPEISYEEAMASRDDLIIATGRSDYPNQVNNVLGFPFIFRGALDVRATAINMEMKLAATRALASLAKEDVPDSVCQAYRVDRLTFGRDYLIPKPFDPRVLLWEATAVAEAAMLSGVAREPVDLEAYRERLERQLGKAHQIARMMVHKAQAKPKQVIFPEGENEKILRACHSLVEEKIATPILLGNPATIHAKCAELGFELKKAEIVDPATSSLREAYIQELFRLRQRRGVTLADARTLINDHDVFGSLMLHLGQGDALVSGVTRHFPDVLRPALQIVRMREGLHKVSGCYAMITRSGDLYFMADTSVNIEPTAEDLVEIALCVAQEARRFDIVPRVAMLSFSSFGSTKHPQCEKVRKAVEMLHQADPTLIVDGEIMADAAVSPETLDQYYPFSTLKGGANVLVFPDLNSANIAYKLLKKLGGGKTLGPILMGMSKPVHLLWRGAEVDEIVNAAAIAVVDAQEVDDGAAGAVAVNSSAVSVNASARDYASERS